MEVIRNYNGELSFEEMFASIIDAEIEKLIEKGNSTEYNEFNTVTSHDKGECDKS